MSALRDHSVVVTGGAGFLGSKVVQKLRERGYRDIFVPRSREYDLCREEEIVRLLQATHPATVIHLAAVVGRSGADRANPGEFFYDNAIMGIQLMEQSRLSGVQKFVCVGTICSYPKFTPIPFSEDNLWNGYPEETNAPYGLAKKMLLVQAQAYRQQYGFNAIYLLPVNLYGPGDNFDPRTSHVISALIRKCVDARNRGERIVKAWGTGAVSREFLYVDDAAEGIVLATEHYNKAEPVNLGSGEEITILNLAHLIRELSGYAGRFEWDTTQPNGQPRRRLDISRAKREFGFEAKTRLREGLRIVIGRYEKQSASGVFVAS